MALVLGKGNSRTLLCYHSREVDWGSGVRFYNSSLWFSLSRWAFPYSSLGLRHSSVAGAEFLLPFPDSGAALPRSGVRLGDGAALGVRCRHRVLDPKTKSEN